jgi:hypothetical protein
MVLMNEFMKKMGFYNMTKLKELNAEKHQNDEDNDVSSMVICFWE